ncbi:MAG: 3',5'-nucleoside bisphosphate phosphatase [Pseudomonadota bacterium]
MPSSPNYDLHCHSTASDGLLVPAEVVRRAAANGVGILALTDHDEICGLAEARAQAAVSGVRFINGVEISIGWGGISIHVVGLNVDPDNPQLQQGLEAIRRGRTERAKRMAQDLERVGIPGSLEGAYAYAENPNLIGRTHFARFLAENHYVSDVRSVFQHYLVHGKPGYVAHQWATLQEGLAYIEAGGGIAVVAHPGRYKMTRAEMRRFLAEFKDRGGAGIEVISSSHTPEQCLEYAIVAKEFSLVASRGSDFHGPGESRVDLGGLPNLAADLKPVWHDW